MVLQLFYLGRLCQNGLSALFSRPKTAWFLRAQYARSTAAGSPQTSARRLLLYDWDGAASRPHRLLRFRFRNGADDRRGNVQMPSSGLTRSAVSVMVPTARVCCQPKRLTERTATLGRFRPEGHISYSRMTLSEDRREHLGDENRCGDRNSIICPHCSLAGRCSGSPPPPPAEDPPVPEYRASVCWRPARCPSPCCSTAPAAGTCRRCSCSWSAPATPSPSTALTASSASRPAHACRLPAGHGPGPHRHRHRPDLVDVDPLKNTPKRVYFFCKKRLTIRQCWRMMKPSRTEGRT